MLFVLKNRYKIKIFVFCFSFIHYIVYIVISIEEELSSKVIVYKSIDNKNICINIWKESRNRSWKYAISLSKIVSISSKKHMRQCNLEEGANEYYDFVMFSLKQLSHCHCHYLNDFKLENYLKYMKRSDKRKYFTRLRVSAHNRKIEIRWHTPKKHMLSRDYAYTVKYLKTNSISYLYPSQNADMLTLEINSLAM